MNKADVLAALVIFTIFGWAAFLTYNFTEMVTR